MRDEDLKRAEEFYRIGLDICIKVLGDRHPKTSATASKLGALLEKQGLVNESIRLYSTALDGYINTVGKTHDATIDAQLKLGGLYRQKKDWHKAARMYSFVRDGLEEGGTDPRLLEVQRNYTEMNDRDKSISFEKVQE